MTAMNRYLLFQLYGPMSAWGEVAVGESRVTAASPGRSGLLGILSAALGIRRDDESGLEDLARGLCFGVLTQSSGLFLRDYHTAQVPPASALKGRPARTRRDELAVPKDDLATILSARDYRVDASYCVAVEAVEGAQWSLEQLMSALQRPVFPIYLGRKACPTALPLQPQIIEAENLLAAFCAARFVGPEELTDGFGSALPESIRAKPPFALAWEEGMASGLLPERTVARRDQPRTRRRWQFDERVEHHAMIEKLGEAPCT